MNRYEYGRCEDCLYLNGAVIEEPCKPCLRALGKNNREEFSKWFTPIPIPLGELIDDQ